MPMNEWVLVTCAGIFAGAMNAMAGGGSFVTLPTFIAVGVPSVQANATSTIALYPGGVASAWVYRDGLTRVCGVPLLPTLLATLVGGLVGALLLLLTPGSVFDHVLPWLLLAATLALAFGSRVGPAVRARFRASVVTIVLIQFVLGVYGGYFGGAVGLMMMATWCLLDGADVKALNAPRTLLVTAANTVAVLCFAVAGAVRWQQALVAGAGALVGGYGGARIGRRLPSLVIRVVTVLIAAAMTLHFFVRAYA